MTARTRLFELVGHGDGSVTDDMLCIPPEFDTRSFVSKFNLLLQQSPI
jgi:hypothetical protein